jgi:spore coat assembly protein SafA
MIIHTVERGDTLWQIAKMHRVSLDALIAANPQIMDPNKILPGTQIYVPSHAGHPRGICPLEPQAAEPRAQASMQPLEADPPLIYQVNPGESWQIIAARYGLTVGEIKRCNGHLANEELDCGHKILIPCPALPTKMKDQFMENTEPQQCPDNFSNTQIRPLAPGSGRMLYCPYCGKKIPLS